MEVIIDGVRYAPEGSNPQIKLGGLVFDNPEHMLWSIYSWYTHQVWEAGRNGDKEDLKKCIRDVEVFEECVKDVFGMEVPDNEYCFKPIKTE